MVGDELAVEQHIAARPQPADKMRQRDLRCIGRAAEHALAEEGATERDTVKPAHHLSADVTRAPHLDRMGMTPCVENAVGLLDLRIDPRLGAIDARGGAMGNDPREIMVRRHREPIRAQRLA